MKICIAGKNSIAVNFIKHLAESCNISKTDLLVLCTKGDDGFDNWQPSVRNYAISTGIEITELNKLYDLEDLIFISLQYDKIVKPELFKSSRLFNVHFSMLPEYRGMYTSIIPILRGEGHSGVTLHEIDNGIDTGPIIANDEIKIGINDTSRDLYFKYLEAGERLIISQAQLLFSGEYCSSPQNDRNSSYYGKESIDFNKIEIDLRKTSFEIHNNIRAFIFQEFQLPVLLSRKIIKSELTDEIIQRNFLFTEYDKIILSGTDGYKVILNLLNDQVSES